MGEYWDFESLIQRGKIIQYFMKVGGSLQAKKLLFLSWPKRLPLPPPNPMKSGTETRKTTGTGTVGIKPAMKLALFPRPLDGRFHLNLHRLCCAATAASATA